MTQIQVNKSDRDVIARECAYFFMEIEFFTIEHNENLLLARFPTSDPELMWRLGKIVGHAIELEEWKKTL